MLWGSPTLYQIHLAHCQGKTSQCQRLVKMKGKKNLFKELYKLNCNNLMSSLKSQSLLEYPQMHGPSFPLCPVQGTVSQKKKQKSVVLLCPSHVVPKRPHMAAAPGFKPYHQSSFATPFLTLPTIGHSCQHSVFFQLHWAAIVSPGRCGPVVWRQSSTSFCRFCNQGELPPSYIIG